MNNIVIILGIVITLATGVPVMMQLVRQHPKGLFILFFAEMWERFSYYGMRGLLVFYLVQHFLFDDKFAGTQYGSYTSLVYLLPLVGGVLADRYLGTRKSILFGAVLLTVGQLAMAATAPPARQTLTYQGHAYELSIAGRMAERQVRLIVGGKPYEFGADAAGGLAIKNLPSGAPLPADLPKGSYKLSTERNPLGVELFYFALSMIIMGVGFLKPNISTIVGQLYPQGDPRRDSGFTLYYYGVNLGAFWAGVLCGYLGQTVGWWAGFGLAGVGMALGWVVFMAGRSWLEGHGEPPDPLLLKSPWIGPFSREWIIYILGVAGAAGVYFVVQHNDWVGIGLYAAILASLAFILWFVVFQCNRVQRERMLLAMVLIFGAVVFFTLFEQAGTSLNLFAARNVDLTITHEPKVWAMGGLNVIFASRDQLAQLHGAQGLWIDTSFTAAQTQSFNPGFILIFAPVFAALWAFLGKRNLDPNPVLKFGIGLLQVGLGFMVVVWGARYADSAFREPLILLGLLYLLHTTGELCLSPVGLSEITKLSVPSVVSFMMAVWFLASSIAQFIGGKIAAMTGTETVGGQVLDPAAALHTSLFWFVRIGWAGIGAGALFVVLSPFLKHWAHGINDPAPEEPIIPESPSPAVAREG
jgi:POT family proton-dependent oligopeptide transporter